VSISELKLYDRSRVTTDWTCPRKRFWNYEYNGRGIVSSNTSLDLFMGICLHDGLAGIARGFDIEELAPVAKKQMFDALTEHSTGVMEEIDYAAEQSTLLEGMLRGFHKQVWPRIQTQFPIILCIEEEMRYDHDGLVFMSKPDLVVGDNDGNVAYVEYKSTSSKSEGWVNGWSTAVQLHSTIKAIKATKDIDVNQVIVQGLYKGFTSYGKQSSPFCYGYFRKGQPPFTEDQLEYSYKAGFKRTPTWEMDGGVKGWIEGMPESVLSEQFPQVPPIFINDDMVNNFFKQRGFRENEIQLALGILESTEDPDAFKNVLDVAFPQKFDSCSSYYGRECEFKRICFGNVDDPLTSGWEERIPHHQLELDEWSRVKNDQTNTEVEAGI
jgi:hypothetical protein